MELFFSRIQVKIKKKKGFHQNWNTCFPRIQVETCIQICTPESNYWGDANVDHTQIIGGMQSNYWGGYSPPSPPGFVTFGSSITFCCFVAIFGKHDAINNVICYEQLLYLEAISWLPKCRH